MMVGLRLSALLACLFFAGCASVKPASTFRPTPPEARLASLIVERLEISRQVAWIKFQNNTPVRDQQREQLLLTTLAQQAQGYHLPPATVQRFFRAQIDASCQVQSDLLYHWNRGAALPTYPPRDLKSDIRPALDRISTQMLVDLAALQTTKPRSGVRAYTASLLHQQGFPWLATRTATQPLP